MIAASGTSQSAPAVANLAGKLWAIAPELSAAEVRAIIESTATAEGPQKLKVINPQAAVARVRDVSDKDQALERARSR